MLNFFRKSRRSILGMVLVAFIALTMLSFGLSIGKNGRSSSKAAATVNDHTITFNEYYKTRENLIRYYRQRFQGNFEQFSQFLRIDQQTIDSMVNDILVQDFFNQLGLTASVTAIQEKIGSQEFFKQSGFTKDSYLTFLRATGFTEEKLKEVFAKDLIQDQLTTAFSDLLQPTTIELKTIYNEENRQSQFRYMEINSVDFENKITTVSDDLIKDYFTKNSANYRKPKTVRYSFVQLKPEDFSQKIELSQEDLNLTYDEQKLNFIEPSQLHLKKIFFKKSERKDDALKKLLNKDKASAENLSETTVDPNLIIKQKAESALKRINSGEDFSKVAQEVSEDNATAASGGDLGWIAEKDIPKELVTATKRLSVKQTSEIIDTEDGFYLVYLEDIKPQHQKTLDEVKPILETQIRQTQAPIYARAQAYNLYNLWLKENTKPLTEFAKTQNLTATEVDKFLTAEENPQGISDNLTTKSIEYSQGSHEIFDLGNNIYLVDVIEVKESYIPELTDIKEKIIGDFKKEEGNKQAKEFANKLLSEIITAKSFDEPAKKNQVVIKETQLSMQKDLSTPPFNSEEIKQKVFALTLANPTANEVFENNQNYFIVQLLQNKLPDGRDFESKKSDLLKTEKENIKPRISDTLLAILKAEAKINIDPSIYDKS